MLEQDAGDGGASEAKNGRANEKTARDAACTSV
jgi:hypothetical protein